jgi:hypothetical protein
MIISEILNFIFLQQGGTKILVTYFPTTILMAEEKLPDSSLKKYTPDEIPIALNLTS